nr:DUF3300 domain-containing protein [uncultured Shimia sp.]
MRDFVTPTLLIFAMSTYPTTSVFLQEAAASGGASTAAVSADDQTEADAGLTDQELDELVAPVALYPDTLLIQVLVASTYPLEVVKADRWLSENEGLTQDEITAAVEKETWDPSVGVLATAFPDVLDRMAQNIDWTELMGTAMLAQSDDVMASVQRMREAAIDAGSLVDSEEQEVSRDETDAVVILPSDPEVVYVPTYDTTTVYHQNNDALIFFGAAILMTTIFRSNNYWGGYWGCRNCGGWNGRPIHHRPGGINVNGNVNIGNDINVGGGWKPEPRREARAKDQLRDRPSNGAGNKRPGAKAGGVPSLTDKPSRGDAMRKDLGKKTGAKDITRPENRPAASKVGGGDRPKANATRPGNKGASKRPATPSKSVTPARKKPAAKPAAKPRAKPQARKAKPSSMQRHQSGAGARKSGSRGGAAHARGGRR